jgi:hypothetical protein
MAAPGGKTFTTEEIAENERLVKLGLLLVQMGVAKKEDVFPEGLRAPPPLLDRSSIALKPRAPWWKTLFGLMLHRNRQPFASPAAIRVNEGQPHALSDLPDGGQKTSNADAGETTKIRDEEIDVGRVDAAPSMQRPRVLQLSQLRPLSYDDVGKLRPAVTTERNKLLEAERNIHETLTQIEDTRHFYLLPQRVLSCEREIDSVTKCYAETLARESASARDTLQCAENVAGLKRCAEDAVLQFTPAD